MSFKKKIYNIIDKYPKKYEKIIIYLNGIIYSFNYLEKDYKKIILSLEQSQEYGLEASNMLKIAKKQA